MLMRIAADRKVCNTCSVTKPRADFYRESRLRDGLRGECIECARAASSDWDRANPERHAARVMRAYRKDLEASRKAQRDRRAADPEPLRALDCARYERNPQARKDSAKAWYLANPDRVQASRTKRRTILEAVIVDAYISVPWLRERDGDDCYYCGVGLVFDYGHERSAELEHKQPLSRGGLHSESNCVLACRSCNRRKQARTEAEFRAVLAGAGV